MYRKHNQHQDHQSAATLCLSSKILCIYIILWIFFLWLLIQSWISSDDKLVRKSVWSDLLHVASSESLNMAKIHTSDYTATFSTSLICMVIMYVQLRHMLNGVLTDRLELNIKKENPNKAHIFNIWDSVSDWWSVVD